MKGLEKMKVLLIKDVYKLGRAGEIKKVAAGFGRNFLIPKGFALQATPGAMLQADRIKVKATERRAVLNEELGSVADVLDGKTLTFAVKAGETGRLYGSVSGEDLIEAIQTKYEIELEKRQVETEPLRQLGTYNVPIHLTMDLIPEITVIIHREGEIPGEEKEVEKVTAEVEKAAPEEIKTEEADVGSEAEEEAPEEVEAEEVAAAVEDSPEAVEAEEVEAIETVEEIVMEEVEETESTEIES